MFRHRRQLRRWAVYVLLAWLFGLSAGVANACLTASLAELGLQRSGHLAASTAKADTAMPTCAQHHEGHRAQSRAALDHHALPGQPDCLDFCDKATISIPTLKSVLDQVDGSALPPPVIAMVAPVPAALPVQLWVPRRDGVLAPPIRIAFLRLTL